MKQIAIDELDFDLVKENLKTFLRAQPEFNSYDFEGSALTILLDILAYNTTYNASYLNMAINESFIDSASKRSSLISLSKALGYTANSVRSSVAKINVSATLPVTDTTSILTLPKGSIFNGIVEDTSYSFTTLTDYSAVKNADGVFVFEGVSVHEGVLINNTYTVTQSSKFIIPSVNVDLTSLNVLVRESNSSSETVRFNRADDLFRVKPTDAIYFVKQRDDLFYEVFFGSDGVGRSLINGNVVRLEYLETNGEASNGANSFVYQSGFRSDATLDVETTQSAVGGTEQESVESIRFNAPRSYVTQNRAVTAADYENLLLSNYPTIESLHAWGGQDNIPKVFGKVFICAKPLGRPKFSTSEKASMEKSLINSRGVVSINPVIIDPMYMNIELSCNVYYNLNATKWSEGQLRSLVQNTLIDYGKSLNKFDSVFRYSKVSALVDSSDPTGIVSNSVSFRIRCPMDPMYNSNSQYKLITGNPIDPGTFYSTRFYIVEFADRAYIKDNSRGVLELYTEDLDGIPTYQYDVGIIDYPAGTWDVGSLTINKLHDAIFEFVFIPKSNDVVSNRNVLVSLPTDTITVNMITDNIANGSESGGETFIFSKIR
jgi:hypothetical protein